MFIYCSKIRKVPQKNGKKNNHTATSATPKILINEAIEARNFLGQLHRQVEAIASHWRLCPNEETALFSRALSGMATGSAGDGDECLIV